MPLFLYSKLGDKIDVGDVTIEVVSIQRNRVRLAYTGPRSTEIVRHDAKTKTRKVDK